MTLETKIKRLPRRPGVYLMKDAEGRILYVGKAKDLRTRVRNYLRPEADGRVHIKVMMGRVFDLDWLVTNSEKEALILENNLIKKHRPRYNLSLKDDKNYLSLRLTVQESFPRLEAVRRIRHDGAMYFGPYSSARHLRETIDLIMRIFPLRRCTDREFRLRTRPCLYCQTRGCKAPCCGLVDRVEYGKVVDEVILFLKGRNSGLFDHMKHLMINAASEERFEDAAILRDRLRAVEMTLERQKAVVPEPVDRDVIGWVREGAEAQVAVLIIRAGVLIDRRGYYLRDLIDEDAPVISEFLRRYYGGDRIVPPEVIVPIDLGEEEEFLAEWLTESRGGKVRLTNPVRGEKRDLVTMAEANASELLAERRKSKVGYETALEELKTRLGLPSSPHRMECFDISNFQGTEAVASMVTFIDGFPHKGGYRRFKIKTVEGADDFAMLYEAVTRRLARKNQEGWELPDLLVIDGGRGQLASVMKALEDADITLSGVIGLAKERPLPGTDQDPAKTPERIFLPGRKNPVIPPKNSSALFMLQRIRDEAHRFAVTYHRMERTKRTLLSELDSLPGIGPKRKRALLTHFGSVKAVRAASSDELAKAPGISQTLADEIARHLRTA